jgi:hypothetical protein
MMFDVLADDAVFAANGESNNVKLSESVRLASVHASACRLKLTTRATF